MFRITFCYKKKDRGKEMRSVKKINIILVLVLITTLYTKTSIAIDTDDDGLPDEWELLYFRTLYQNGSDDFDDDGMNNYAEWLNETNPSSPFSGGRVKAAYTYSSTSDNAINQMTVDKIRLLQGHGINTFITNGGSVGYDYSTYPDFVLPLAKQNAELAYNLNFSLFIKTSFSYRPFRPGATCIIPGGYPNYFSDGTQDTHISPFCRSYWEYLTNISVALANLSVNYPDRYRIDGIFFDFEPYEIDPNKAATYFDARWGFEDQTFDKYCHDRGYDVQGWNSTTIPVEYRFNWLVQHDCITPSSDGYHTGDYYLFLSSLVKGYASEMRERVKTVNQDFLIGAYPSPIPTRYYLVEIFSGWSTITQPAIIWATEMYGGGGANNIPQSLAENLLPQGFYNLSPIYKAKTSPDNKIYAYYVGGVLNSWYFSGNWAYHLYHLATRTNGYWIFTTYGFTQTLNRLTAAYPVLYYDRVNNIVYKSEYGSPYTPCNNQDTYTVAVQDYYDQMDAMNVELREYFKNYPAYQTSLSLISPPHQPPVLYYYPTISSPPNASVTPREQVPDSMIELPEAKIRFENQHNFLIYAAKNHNIEIRFLTYLWSYYCDVKSAVTYAIYSTEGTELKNGIINRATDPYYSGYTGIPGSINFTAPADGIYILFVNPQGSWFEITHTNAPISLYKPYREPTENAPLSSNDYIHILDVYADHLNRVYSLYFYVDDISSFTVSCLKKYSSYGFRATVSKPSGSSYETIASNETSPASDGFSLNVTVPDDAKNSIWQLSVSKPLTSGETFRDVMIRFDNSIKPYFSLTDTNKFFLIENNKPTAVNDTFTVQKNSINTLLNVLINDFDFEQKNLSIATISQPAHGTAVIAFNQTHILYTPQEGYTGDDVVQYTISDGYISSSPATIRIYIPSSNPAPQPPENGGSTSYASINSPPNASQVSNIPPQKPSMPLGPVYVIQNRTYTYITVSWDYDDDHIRYCFDWGEGTYSWSEFMISNMSFSVTYSWGIPGSYSVRVLAQDEHGDNSSWSEPLTVVVASCNSSNASLIVQVSCPETGYINQTVFFNATGSISLSSTIISIAWDFGDGTQASGLSVTHRYTKNGTYTVRLTITDAAGNSITKTMVITITSHVDETMAQAGVLPFSDYKYFAGGIVLFCAILVGIYHLRNQRIKKHSMRSVSSAIHNYKAHLKQKTANLSKSTTINTTQQTNDRHIFSKKTSSNSGIVGEIERLITLAHTYSWNPKKAWEYYYLAKQTVIAHYGKLDHMTEAHLKKKLVELYNRL